MNSMKRWAPWFFASVLAASLATAGAIKTWSTGETLTSADLNANFQHIHNNMVGGHGARLVDADVSGSANIASSKLAAYRYIPVAWAQTAYSGACTTGTCTLQASQGVTSVVHTAGGVYTITMSTTRTNTSYNVLATTSEDVVLCVFAPKVTAPTTTTFRINCFNTATSAATDAQFGFVVYDND